MSSCFLQFDQTGNPAEVLQLHERALAPPSGHEVRVRMRYAPVNPADLNFIEGTYGRAAHPPGIPGPAGGGPWQPTARRPRLRSGPRAR
jgi:trans-2-enoyl-CoA reductase